MRRDKSEVMQGTLDLMVLKTLESMGPQHGYGIARRIEQISGLSGNNRRAKFYSITRAGHKQLQSEAENWKRVSGVMGRILQLGEE